MSKQWLHMAEIPVRFHRRKGMRRMALSVAPDGLVSLTAARSTPLFLVERFVMSRLEWLRATLDHFGHNHQSYEERRVHEAHLYRHFRDEARRTIEARLRELNRPYQFPVTRICIRNQRSRWGSASATGRLSFNYRLIFLPKHLRDYVIVHELCHLGELNHSPRFWALVAETIPEYRALCRELRALNPLSLGPQSQA